MTDGQCKVMAGGAVVLLAYVLEQLDKLDPDLSPTTRTDTAVRLTCAMLTSDK